MEFGELRRLIDCCLENEVTIDKKYSSFVTHDIDKISEYVDILEGKKKPLYSPPNFKSASFIKLESLNNLKKESEQIIIAKESMILAKGKEYKQINLTLNQSLVANESQQVALKKELEACQEKLNSLLSESPVYRRLLYWSAKMQGSNLGEDESNVEKQLTVKIKNLQKQISLLKKKLAQLKLFIENEKAEYNKSINTLNLLIKAQKARNFEKEIEQQQNQAEREFNIKFNQYKEHYEAKLKSYENSISARIIKRLCFDISKFNSQILTTQKLNWELLPTGERSFKKLKDYLQTIPKLSDVEFDFERLDKIISLNADEIYYGVDEFEGYLVFYFGKIKVAVLDCPIKGNAIYIFGEDWKNLSRLSKSKLLNFYPNKTKRIIHKGDWFEKLKSFLNTHYKNFQIENAENLLPTD